MRRMNALSVHQRLKWEATKLANVHELNELTTVGEAGYGVMGIVGRSVLALFWEEDMGTRGDVCLSRPGVARACSQYIDLTW